MSGQEKPVRCVTYELQIDIEASRERVWHALTTECQQWWLPDFRMTGPESEITLDAQAGGHWVERQPNGASLLWYTVHMSRPHIALDLVGWTGPEWGGPSTSMLHLGLEDHAAGTRFVVRDAIFGHVTDQHAESLSGGWKQLFGDGLKVYAES